MPGFDIGASSSWGNDRPGTSPGDLQMTHASDILGFSDELEDLDHGDNPSTQAAALSGEG